MNRQRLQRLLPLLALLLGLYLVADGLRPEKPAEPYAGFDLARFGDLPVQEGGRVKPLDTVARNALLILRGKTTVALDNGEKRRAIEWLLEHAMRPEVADTWPVFRIDHEQVLALIGKTQQDGKYFAFSEIAPHIDKLSQAAARAETEPKQQTPFEKQLLQLARAINLYDQLGVSFHPPDGLDELDKEYPAYLAAMRLGTAAIRAREEGASQVDEEMIQLYTGFFGERYGQLARVARLGIVPPEDPAVIDWDNVGVSLLHAKDTGGIHPVVQDYADLTLAFRKGDAEAFNAELASLHGHLDDHPTVTGAHVPFEAWFNHVAPFYRAMVLYVFIFALAVGSWILWPQTLGRAAFRVLVLAFAVHTFGLVARMIIQDRPPVTNLYSSAVFVGWGAVLLGLVLEALFKRGIGSAMAAVVGFCTLLVARALSESGDTLEMMRAVLDSNFWLATHVVVITFGYSAVFLAGFLALAYILLGLFTPWIDEERSKILYGMVYGITCFGLLLSFVGTMLGGVWADQSWGRFWGWDPKENGALMIVIWGALMLHARWGGIVKRRGFMILAVGGNVITAWSWFGTNLLGIGLHSYGFTDSGFFALLAFWISQFIVMALGASIAPRNWKSPGTQRA